MRPRTRSRILGILAIVALIAAIREISIRRHADDLHPWPDDDTDLRAS